ncbi:MAG: LTA synthase family protein [Bacteroidales bacterium]|nr:LTA synthase family protein [Bacteroidales bacterium]
MKDKIPDSIFRFLVINIAFLPVMVTVRAMEFFFLSHAPTLQENALATEAWGLLYDFRALLVFALIFFPFFLLISLIRKRAGAIFYITLLALVTILQFALIRYFSINLVPLDDVVFRYSIGEINMIVNNSDTLGFLPVMPLILLILMLLVLQYLAGRIRVKPRITAIVVTTYAIALFLALIPSVSPDASDEESAYFFEVNKSAYFIQESLSSLFRHGPATSIGEIAAEIEHYQKSRNEFDFTSKNYPLVHKENAPDVLGPYFNLGSKPPNLVFIVVESLSSAFVGEDSWYGNFTPFLDSLQTQSLYWDNFLSISERTFHVFPSIFGSLPFGNGEFQEDAARMPFHYSLIRYLKENGYFTGVYYGGDYNFTNYNEFFRKEGTDFMMTYFGPGFREKRALYPGFQWGYHDEYTFSRSLEVIDSLDKDPRLDIYLTLSSHHPYEPPHAGDYLEQYDKITGQPDYPAEKKQRTDPNRKIFSAILYTDDALRTFLKTYSLRKDFDNTIFFITGDHFFMEFGYSSVSAIERYHVPLIIYSPMLKSPHHFSSVSTHQDITPSLIAMLQNKYQFEKHPFVHWLGAGIDTSTTFRNIHTTQFVTNDWEMVDLLKGSYYLSKNRLYKIKPGMETIPVADEPKLKELKEDLHAATAVTQYVNRNDRIVLRELFRKIEYDTVRLFTFDTSGLVLGNKRHLYIRLVPPVQFDTTYWKLGYDLEFQYTTGELADTAKLPRVIVSVEDSSGKNALYHQIPFPGRPTTEIKPGTWYHFRISEVLNVGSIESLQEKTMKIYLFNPEQSIILPDSIYFRLDGIN